MFVVHGMAVAALFMISLMMPIFSFLLPVYKIKKMRELDFRQKVLINIIAIMLIILMNPMLLSIYIGFFIVIELFYYYFEKINYSVKKFDRITITALVVTAFMVGIFFLVKKDIDANIGTIMEMYQQRTNFSMEDVQVIFKEIKLNSLWLIFTYSMLCSFMTYFSLDKKNYENWEISYGWVLIYITTFFAAKIFKIDNFYINNLMEIGKVIFIFFGLKSIYTALNKILKIRILNSFIAIFTSVMFPFLTFVIGVVSGFKIDKILFNEKK